MTPVPQSPTKSAPDGPTITGTGLRKPARNGTAELVEALAEAVGEADGPGASARPVRPTRRTTLLAHSATTADVPTVSPSCPITIATPLAAACASRTARGAGTVAQSALAWP